MAPMNLRMLLFGALALFPFVPGVVGQSSVSVTTQPMQEPPGWASQNALQLSLTLHPGGTLPSQFTVIPLTTSVGLNGTGTEKASYKIPGRLVAANSTSMFALNGNSITAYLSCDPSPDDADGTFITPDKILAQLMTASLRAIILYSISDNFCMINPQSSLPYGSIFSLADSGDAGNILAYINGTNPNITSVDSLITGSTDHPGNSGDPSGNPGGSTGNNSTVAMSILYTITGVISVLFLVIIATGAVRAHRHPERYGPRGGHAGRPRQSRAKGIARAVLDTIPIVKFGKEEQAKPDPNMELESGSNGAVTEHRNAHDITDDASVPVEAAGAQDGGGAELQAAPGREHTPPPSTEETPDEPSHLGCSICTEDFEEGVDVRLLPCKHQFHPDCVDPWLVNVSGTCPLCRFDLRPENSQGDDSAAELDGDIAPPLAPDEAEPGTEAQHGNRFSRLLDANRLRNASVEERLAALRQMRDQAADSTENTTSEPRHAARLTDRLRDKFRIRTHAQQ